MNNFIASFIEFVIGALLGFVVFVGALHAISEWTYNPKVNSDKPYFVYQGY